MIMLELGNRKQFLADIVGIALLYPKYQAAKYLLLPSR